VSTPLVSIITPCFNHEKYLDDYFRSLLAQTYRNLEIIILDDGSTDGSWKKICEYEPLLRREFPSVTCLRNERMGVLKELAMGVSLMRGDLCCILESDDYYLPEKIQRNVEYLSERPEFGGVHSDYLDVSENGKVLRTHNRYFGYTIPSGWIYEALLITPFIKTLSFCCRAHFMKDVDFKRYAERRYLRGDSPMSFELARRAPIGYIDRPLCGYRILSESASHTRDPRKKIKFIESSFAIKFDYIREFGAPDEVKEWVTRDYYLTLYKFGYRYYDKERFLRGYDWLIRTEPSKYKTFFNEIRFFAVHINFFHWAMLKLDLLKDCWRRLVSGSSYKPAERL
jgi:glycosyltransferase involved in cell wall biosynthesis